MRKYINMTIVFLSTILAGVFWFTGIVGYLPIAGLMIVFNIICLIFYRETRLIIAYHAVTIFIIIGFFVTAYQLVSTEEVWLLFRSFVDVGGFAIFFISFGILLQTKTRLSIERLLMTLTVYNILFYTSNRYVITGYLVGFFQTNEAGTVNRIISSFNITNFVVMFFVALIQVYLIYRFDKRLTKRGFLEDRKQQRIEDKFY
ncbi:MAG: hypothetical protein PF513_00275 [Tenericutes bacterium]|jgi:hypothetical protein|nr:hypothetical protein [Mycoplasmatota bacterium]